MNCYRYTCSLLNQEDLLNCVRPVEINTTKNTGWPEREREKREQIQAHAIQQKGYFSVTYQEQGYMMITEEQLESALTYMKTRAGEYAHAKAERRYLEEFRKTLKARLYHDSELKTVADKEQWAYGHHEYEELLIGLKAAVEIEEKLRWELEAARITCEIYRTQESSRRQMVSAAL